MKFLVQNIDLFEGYIMDVQLIEMDITPTTINDLKPIFHKWVEKYPVMDEDDIERYWEDFVSRSNICFQMKFCSRMYDETMTTISWFVQ